jgi:hypothetical protein
MEGQLLWTASPRPRIALGAPVVAVASRRVTTLASYGERLNGGAACPQRQCVHDAQGACWEGREVSTAEMALVPSAQHPAPPGDAGASFE